MARTVGIGYQDFERMTMDDVFYVDKTRFIKEWWENKDEATLITRSRRFGKTLTMSMVEKFFSVEYAGRGDLFEGLAIWEEERYRKLQGTYPVISLSFANVKQRDPQSAVTRICQLLTELYRERRFLLQGDLLTEEEKEEYRRISMDMPKVVAAMAVQKLAGYLSRYYGKRAIILLDEYDTPLQEAYVNGYWDEMVDFTRDLFNATFKTNPYLERAIMTGITRVSTPQASLGKESIFSDLNHLEVVTTTSRKYMDTFGFTQQEVSDALKEYGLSEKEGEVQAWYDGFTFGTRTDIYNPWSILNFLDKGLFSAYWANSSSNSLIDKLIRESSEDIKVIMEDLLEGKSFRVDIDEQIVFSQLGESEGAIWSLLLASGYLKVGQYEGYRTGAGRWIQEYDLELTNFEVKTMFQKMIQGWFGRTQKEYNAFVKALLQGDVEAMNAYMSEISETVFSSFDTGKRPSHRARPERFYHGLVLGLMMELGDRYVITSNRESGFGRYDVQLEPRQGGDDGILLEFKVRDPKKEASLEETVQNALRQIREKDYAGGLRQRGIPAERIRMYGFAFEGKTVLIG